MQELVRPELQSFQLEVLKTTGIADRELGAVLNSSGEIGMSLVRQLRRIRPKVSVWYKVRIPDVTGYVMLTKFRVLRNGAAVFANHIASPFVFESDVVSSEIMDFHGFHSADKATGQWVVDVSYKCLSPQDVKAISKGTFAFAIERFTYQLLSRITFTIRDDRVRLTAEGTIDATSAQIRDLQKRKVNLDDI